MDTTTRDEVVTRLKDLAEFAQTSGENTTAMVLYALLGSLLSGQDKELCHAVGEHTIKALSKVRSDLTDLASDEILDAHLLS